MAAQDQEPEWVEQLIRGLNNQNHKPVTSPTFHEANQWDNNDWTLRLMLALEGTAAEWRQGETAEEIAESLMNRY